MYCQPIFPKKIMHKIPKLDFCIFIMYNMVVKFFFLGRVLVLPDV